MKRNRRDFILSGTGLALGAFGLGRAQNPVSERDCTECVFETIHNRRSVRKYKSDPVPDEHVRKILEAARMAPTAGNQQPWKFLVIRDRQKLDALAQASIAFNLERAKGNQSEEELKDQKQKMEEYYTGALSATVYVVVLTDNQSVYPTYNHYDGPLAAANLMIAARALGYGTVFYTDTFNEAVVKKVFNISDRYTCECVTPIGVPETWPDTPEKKKLEDLVAYETL
jgi:nicotinate-nucleotide--dimethylbenzimidazole phosphoribosyltransferase